MSDAQRPGLDGTEEIDLSAEIARAFEAAYWTPEVHQAAADRGISREELLGAVEDDIEELALSARTERDAVHAAQRVLHERRTQEVAERRSPAYRTPNAVATGLLAAIVLVAVEGLVAALTNLPWIPTVLARLTTPALAVVVSIGAVIAFIVAASRAETARTRIRVRVGADEAAAELQARRQQFEEGLRERILVPALRAEINRRAASDVSTVLAIDEAPGLAEVFDLEYEIPTSGRALLIERLSVMRGASIGIAGPRGSGKSTLVAAACEGRLDVPGWGDVFGVKVAAPVVYQHEEFLLHLLDVTAGHVLDVVDASPEPRRHGIVTSLARSLPFVGGLVGDRALASVLPADSLALTAHRHREYVRYQRERSLQGGGEVGIPHLGSATASAALSLSDKTRSLPQLVADFRALVRDIAREGWVVVVAVDELDKIDSGASARLLLNDLKSVFGVPGCFFLVTVSEDALSSFERRGQPLRDVFDSAFDDIIPVAPLQLAEAERLLRRRVIGFPRPFAALCLSMSGGIARDVIRFARAMVISRNSGAEGKIDAIAERLVAQEAAAKGRAASLLAAQRRDHPVSDAVLRWLALLENDAIPPAARLHAFLDARTSCFGDLRAAAAATDASAEALTDLRMLAADTAAWACHTLTVCELFGAGFDEQRFATGVAAGWFDLLAEARGVLPRSAGLCWDATGRVRELAQLPPLGEFVRPDGP